MAEQEIGITEEGGLYQIDQWADGDSGSPIFEDHQVSPVDGFSIDVAMLHGVHEAFLIQFQKGDDPVTKMVALSRNQVKDMRHMLGLALEWQG